MHTGVSSSGTEGARRATGVSDDRPNPEVTDRSKRRRYTEGYKRKVVEEVSSPTFIWKWSNRQLSQARRHLLFDGDEVGEKAFPRLSE